MKKTLFAITVFLLAVTSYAEVATVEIRLYMGKEITLTEKSHVKLRQLAITLVKTSNFNTAIHAKLLKKTPAKIQRSYRATVRDNYLTLSFKTPRSINTIGGSVNTREIVIGMGKQYADALFTIDSTGRVIQHIKYSGVLATNLLKTVKEITNSKK